MISVNDLKNGLTLELDNGLWNVVEFLHVKPGKGAAFVRTKLKNVESGNVIEKTFRAGEKVAKAMLDRREMQYLYKEGKDYVMMDNETYEQTPLSQDQLGDAMKFVMENMSVKILSYKGNVFAIEPPTFVELKVTETEPGVKGNTATNVTKPATVESGATITVPMFVNEGDTIRIDTRTGEYMARV